MLGRGQKLRITVTEDVAAKIIDFNGLSALAPAALLPSVEPRHVLQWVMHNTMQASGLEFS